MTITSETLKRVHNGNGVATSFSFSNIVIYDSSELEVRFVDTDGIETVLVEGTGTDKYTVSVSEYPGTGTITYPSSGTDYLASGEKIIIRRGFPQTQLVEFENQGGFYPEDHEDAFDRIHSILLQHQEQINRAIKLPVATSTSFDFVLSPVEADGYVKVNADADGLEWGDGGSGSSPPPPPPGPDLSGTILLDDGTEANPSHSFEDDDGTGMWRNTSDDSLQFSVEGVSRLRIDDSGTVELSLSSTDVPALKTSLSASNTKYINVSGGTTGAFINTETSGSTGDSNLTIRAEEYGDLNLKGISPFGVQATEYDITQTVEEDQSDALETLAEELSDNHGGGTIVFPQGDYYFTRKVDRKSVV